MNIAWDQIKLNTLINLKYYVRNRLLIIIVIIVCLFSVIGSLPVLFYTSQVDRLQMIAVFFNAINGFLGLLLGLIALFTVFHHISIKCLKVVFTKPCLPEYWLLSHFISPVLISAGLYALILIACLLLAIFWTLPIKAVIALLILTEFFKSFIIISFCTFLGILVHPILALLLLLSLNLLALVRNIVDEAIKSANNAIGLYVLKAIKFVCDAVNYIIPSFNPYAGELGKMASTFKLAAENYPYVVLVIAYSLLVSALFYFASLYLMKKKRYVLL